MASRCSMSVAAAAVGRLIWPRIIQRRTLLQLMSSLVSFRKVDTPRTAHFCRPTLSKGCHLRIIHLTSCFNGTFFFFFLFSFRREDAKQLMGQHSNIDL